MNLREIIIAAPLVLLTVLLGVFPQQMLLSWMEPSVTVMVNAVTSAKTLPASAGAKTVQNQPTPTLAVGEVLGH
jgi:NADH:ubiquinone oxidoreductase subunit 4 (subunit M)